MRPDGRFVSLRKEFWANVRTISQAVGYVERARRLPGATAATGPIKVPTLQAIREAYARLDLATTHLVNSRGRPTTFGRLLLDYFEYRADVLNRFVEPRLMAAEQARQLFDQLRKKLAPTRDVPLNKQSQEKKQPAFLTGIVNMLIEHGLEGMPCDYNPQQLTTVTKDRMPWRTLARRIDGAFPGPVNPIAVWEVKEYYYTTTFGSRVADGVYETLLDGMELEELRSPEHPIHIRHYLMLDAHFTWWVKGRSYLCRVIDMLHMGYVDEVLFGREVETRLPELVREWVRAARKLGE
jgi:hypothetical protein